MWAMVLWEGAVRVGAMLVRVRVLCDVCGDNTCKVGEGVCVCMGCVWGAVMRRVGCG